MFNILPDPSDTSNSMASVPKGKDFDWCKSPPHLLLLSHFLCAACAEHFTSPGWDRVLGESAHAAINRFLTLGLLVPASMAEKINCLYSKPKLKLLLQSRGLPTSGNKEKMQERLIADDPVGMSKLVAQANIFTCSPEAKNVTEQYLTAKTHEKNSVRAEVSTLVNAHDYQGACNAVARYEAKQVFPRGINIDWETYDPTHDFQVIDAIMTRRPKILKALAETEWEPLKNATVLMHLWGTNTAKEWLPTNFVGVPSFEADTSARMLLFHAQFVCNISNFRMAGIKTVTISACGEGSCDTCKKFAGKRFSIDVVPELPHAGCTNEMGCRCDIQCDL